MVKTCSAWIVSVFLAVSAGAASLEEAFRQPPESTRPRCYWYWFDNHISHDGITKDLEAMKRVGIGEAYIGIIHGQSGLPEAPEPRPLSDAWWENITYAVREGTRIGVDIGFFNSPAGSQSGGPWVKPTEAMRYVATRELRLTGPRRVSEKLEPASDRFQPIAVLALPAPLGDSAPAAQETRTPASVTLQFPEPIDARSLTVAPAGALNVSATLESSDDGRRWQSVKEFGVDRHNLNPIVGPIPLSPQIVSFPKRTAKWFRVTFSSPCPFGGVAISPAARIDDAMGKQLAKVFQEPQPPFDFYTWPSQAEPDDARCVIATDAVRNITSHVAADGTVDWDVPAGEWIILQAGMVPTGTVNSPAAPELTGLEIDKMSRAALQHHFDAYVGELLRRLPEQGSGALHHIVADSYEVGPENWTDGFEVDFKQRYGYDAVQYLPVFTGRAVGSVEQSNRFLWDMRRLVADRIARNYSGALRDACAKRGLKSWLENYGHWGFPAEFLQYGGASDEVSGEFWQNGSGVFEGLGSIELRDASSCAHTYGKNVVWAEAFTGGPKFVDAPRDLKARGDWAFCQGINQFTLHVYIHQPDDRRPGISAWFGTEFNRNNTWFDMSKPWFDYQRRCSTLLQAGVHVADVAYYIGEDVPKMTGTRQPPLPGGFDFDYINSEVLLTRATVKDRRLVLPDGMSYRVLVLPPGNTMRPAVLKQIASFVDAGLTVVGPLPTHSPSLEDFPNCDAEVATHTRRLKGRVTESADLSTALVVPADIAGLPEKVLFIHRSSPDAEIYFLSNQSNTAAVFQPTFRVKGRSAELWDAVTGEIRAAAGEPSDDGTKVKIDLDPAASVFVVFRTNASSPNPAVAPLPNSIEIRSASYEAIDGSAKSDVTHRLADLVVNGRLRLIVSNDALGGDPAFNHLKQLSIDYTLDGHLLHATLPENGCVDLPAGLPLPGAWRLDIPGKGLTLPQLIDWSKSQDLALRYFSGTATYRTTFDAKLTGDRVWLHLGQVETLAEVTLNGKAYPAVWMPPYKVDVSSAIQAGENQLQVRVVNNWHNGLVGSVLHPEAMIKPLPSTSSTPGVEASTPLQPGGLIGPVGIEGAELAVPPVSGPPN